MLLQQSCKNIQDRRGQILENNTPKTKKKTFKKKPQKKKKEKQKGVLIISSREGRDCEASEGTEEEDDVQEAASEFLGRL